jgi:hypothetical protein
MVSRNSVTNPPGLGTQGVDWFEMNMLRLGLGGDDEGPPEGEKQMATKEHVSPDVIRLLLL